MAGLMPKVFEEANLSGELRLSGRKLKDFPKTAAKYNLSDTVIAGKRVHSIFIRANCFLFHFISFRWKAASKRTVRSAHFHRAHTHMFVLLVWENKT